MNPNSGRPRTVAPSPPKWKRKRPIACCARNIKATKHRESWATFHTAATHYVIHNIREVVPVVYMCVLPEREGVYKVTRDNKLILKYLKEPMFWSNNLAIALTVIRIYSSFRVRYVLLFISFMLLYLVFKIWFRYPSNSNENGALVKSYEYRVIIICIFTFLLLCFLPYLNLSILSHSVSLVLSTPQSVKCHANIQWLLWMLWGFN